MPNSPKPTSSPLPVAPVQQQRSRSNDRNSNNNSSSSSNNKGRFVVFQFLGQGSGGPVSAARDSTIPVTAATAAKPHGLSNEVALKRISQKHAVSEYGLLLQMQHPHIVRALELLTDTSEIHDEAPPGSAPAVAGAGSTTKRSKKDKKTNVLVMEFAQLGNASKIAVALGRIGASISQREWFARSVTRDILRALFHLHRHRIVHRDVKASNVLLFRDDDAATAADQKQQQQQPTPTGEAAAAAAAAVAAAAAASGTPTAPSSSPTKRSPSPVGRGGGRSLSPSDSVSESTNTATDNKNEPPPPPPSTSKPPLAAPTSNFAADAIARSLLRNAPHPPHPSSSSSDAADAGSDPGFGFTAKLSDFGLATHVEHSTAAVAAGKAASDDVAGSVYWMAPEALQGTVAVCVDAWSIGCLAFELLNGGRPPLADREWGNAMYTVMSLSDEKKTSLIPSLMQLAREKRSANDLFLEELTPQCLDFLTQALTIDPTLRPTAEDLLQHDWVRGVSSPSAAAAAAAKAGGDDDVSAANSPRTTTTGANTFADRCIAACSRGVASANRNWLWALSPPSSSSSMQDEEREFADAVAKAFAADPNDFLAALCSPSPRADGGGGDTAAKRLLQLIDKRVRELVDYMRGLAAVVRDNWHGMGSSAAASFNFELWSNVTVPLPKSVLSPSPSPSGASADEKRVAAQVELARLVWVVATLVDTSLAGNISNGGNNSNKSKSSASMSPKPSSTPSATPAAADDDDDDGRGGDGDGDGRARRRKAAADNIRGSSGSSSSKLTEAQFTRRALIAALARHGFWSAAASSGVAAGPLDWSLLFPPLLTKHQQQQQQQQQSSLNIVEGRHHYVDVSRDVGRALYALFSASCVVDVDSVALFASSSSSAPSLHEETLTTCVCSSHSIRFLLSNPVTRRELALCLAATVTQRLTLPEQRHRVVTALRDLLPHFLDDAAHAIVAPRGGGGGGHHHHQFHPNELDHDFKTFDACCDAFLRITGPIAVASPNDDATTFQVSKINNDITDIFLRVVGSASFLRKLQVCLPPNRVSNFGVALITRFGALAPVSMMQPQLQQHHHQQHPQNAQQQQQQQQKQQEPLFLKLIPLPTWLTLASHIDLSYARCVEVMEVLAKLCAAASSSSSSSLSSNSVCAALVNQSPVVSYVLNLPIDTAYHSTALPTRMLVAIRAICCSEIAPSPSSSSENDGDSSSSGSNKNKTLGTYYSSVMSIRNGALSRLRDAMHRRHSDAAAAGEIVAALRLLGKLFTYSPNPDAYSNCDELVRLLLRLVRSPMSVQMKPAIQEAARLFDAVCSVALF